MFFHPIESSGRLIDPKYFDSQERSKGVLFVLADAPDDLKDSVEGITNTIAYEYYRHHYPLRIWRFGKQKASHLGMLSRVVRHNVPFGKYRLLCLLLVGQYLYVVSNAKSEVSLEKSGHRKTVFSGSDTLLSASGIVGINDIVEATLGDTDPKVFIRAQIVDKPPSLSPDLIPTGSLHPVTPKLNWLKSRARQVIQRLHLNKPVSWDFFRKPSLKSYLKLALTFLVVILLVSVYLSYQDNNYKTKQAEFNNNTFQIETDLNEAYAIKNLNLDRANQLLANTQSLLEKTKALGINQDKIQVYEAKISLLRDDLEKKVDTKFNLYLDLAAQKIEAADFAFSQDTFYLLARDSQVKAVTFKDKRILDLAKVPGGTFIEAVKDRVYVFASDGVYRIEGKTAKKVIEPDSRWQDISDMHAYNSNLYLLDRGAKAVWKYVPGGTGLAFGSNSLGSENKVVLSPSSLAIDGIIWVADKDNIHKYLLEKKETFNLKNFDLKISSNTRLFTDQDEVIKVLLVLDKDIGRIIQVNKNGQFETQYSGDEIRQGLNLTFNAAERKIYLLTRDKIVSFNLEH